MGGGIQTQQGTRETRRKEITHDLTGSPMRRRQSGKHGISLERAVLDQAQTAVEGAARSFVRLVP